MNAYCLVDKINSLFKQELAKTKKANPGYV